MVGGQRAAITLEHDELVAYLASSRVVTFATNGPRGWPHLGPLWFHLGESAPDRPLELWAWTYGRSQKVMNLRRDPRATVQVEDGILYDELRGAVLEVEVVIIEDPRRVEEVGLRLSGRYASDDLANPLDHALLTDGVRASVSAQARKRVALRMIERHRTSWDHRKARRS